MNKSFRLIFGLCLILSVCTSYSQSISNNVIPAAGGFVSAGGVSLSYTIGEPVYKTFSSGTSMLTQGFQQPYLNVNALNLKAYIEGFYSGGGLMQAVIDPIGQPADCDTVILQLARASAPYDILFADTAVLQTNGTAVFQYPQVASGRQFFLVIRHRNSLETWSSTPVSVIHNLTFDMTTSASLAYGNNLASLGSGVFGLYSGDTNQDGDIDLDDAGYVDDGSIIFLAGYVVQDLTGDAIVESSDGSLVENNIGKLLVKP